MTQRPFGIGLVGAGMGARMHALALDALRDTVEVRGVYRRDADKRKAFADQYCFPEAISLEALLDDPAVDALIVEAIAATTRPDLVARLRALDRVLRHGHYVVPQFYSSTFRVAYRSGKFEHPSVAPLYYRPDDWLVSTWWRKK